MMEFSADFTTFEKVKRHMAFPKETAALLDRTISALESLGHETEKMGYISFYPEYPQKHLMIVNAHYFKTGAKKLREDVALKAGAYLQLLNGQSPADIGIIDTQYDKFIGSRLKEIKPVLEDLIRLDEQAEQTNVIRLDLDKKRKLLEETRGLIRFFEIEPEPSFWMEFIHFLQQRDAKGAKAVILKMAHNSVSTQQRS